MAKLITELTETKTVKVEFEDGTSYIYNCEFVVQVGNIAYVEGKKAGIQGIVIEILDELDERDYMKNIIRLYENETSDKSAFSKEALEELYAFLKNDCSKDESIPIIFPTTKTGKTPFNDGGTKSKKIIGKKLEKQDEFIPKNKTEEKKYAAMLAKEPFTWNGFEFRALSVVGKTLCLTRFLKSEDKTIKIVNVPSKVMGYKVIKIGQSAFANCDSIQEIILPETVTTIEEHAFGYCKSLISINIPEKVNTVRSTVFRNCESLKAVNLHDGVAKIYSMAFAFCESLESINIPANLESIGDDAFSGCQKITKLEVSPLNKNYEFRDGFLIYKKSSVVLLIRNYSGKIIIPDNIERLYSHAFEGCTKIKAIKLPATLKGVSNCAFKNCISLEKIELHEGILEIGDYAFENCKSLKSVRIPLGIEKLNYETFKGCSSLHSVELPESLKTIHSSNFYMCTSLAEINFPQSLIEIEGYAFYQCSALKEVVFHEGLLELGDSVFGYCRRLKSVHIPFSTKVVGHNIASGNKSVVFNVYIESNKNKWEPSWNSDGQPVNWLYYFG